jgi:predicted butyrate kinase (DUF1464 family)
MRFSAVFFCLCFTAAIIVAFCSVLAIINGKTVDGAAGLATAFAFSVSIFTIYTILKGEEAK